MKETFLLYVFTRLDAIGNMLAGALALVGIVMFVCLIFVGAGHGLKDYEASVERSKSLFKRLMSLAIVMAVIVVAIPTKSDVAIIVGGRFAIDAARSETGQELAGEVMTAIRAQLKKAAE